MEELKTLSLQNDLLRVQILPEFGGKIVSLRSVSTGEEFLLPPLHEYARVGSSDEFSASDGGGFDECLPSVAACESIAGEPSIPDHGDLWRRPWQVDSEAGAVVLHADSTSRPLRLTRRATLEGATLVLDYELVNLSGAPTGWLWSAHPLLRVDVGDRIVLPDEIKEVQVEYSACEVLEASATLHWPTARSSSGNSVELDRVAGWDGVTAHKLFARTGKSGWAALYRKQIGQGLVVRFDPGTLPFLGLWICFGAWPATGVERQYTVALEPTTSNADSLSSALHNGTAQILNAHEHLRWKLEIELIGAAERTDFDSFSAAVKSCGSGES